MNDPVPAARPLNVLYLVRSAALGGPQTMARLLLHHLPKDRFRITVLPYRTADEADEAFVKACKRQGDEVGPDRLPWRRRLDRWRALGLLRRLIAAHGIDLIHTHDPESNLLIGLHRGRIPAATLASYHGSAAPRGRGGLFLERRIALPRFDAVCTVSDTMRRELAPDTAGRLVRVIRPGLDLSLFDRGGARRAVRARFSLADHHVVVGTLGRLTPEKGHRYLIDAARNLIREAPALRVLIVGAGPARDAIERHAMDCGIRDKVIFTGYHDDLPGILRAMDLFAQPALRGEPFPTAVLEAQAVGLPVIAANVGSMADNLRDGITGSLVSPRDAGALAAALRPLALDPERRSQMGSAGKAWIQDAFRLENMVTETAALYAEARERYLFRAKRT